MHRWWAGDGNGCREKVRLLPPFLVFGAPSSVGACRVMACPTPIPLTTITQEYMHSQCFLNPNLNPVPGGFHFNLSIPIISRKARMPRTSNLANLPGFYQNGGVTTVIMSICLEIRFSNSFKLKIFLIGNSFLSICFFEFVWPFCLFPINIKRVYYVLYNFGVSFIINNTT